MWLHASAHSSHATEVVAVCNVNGPILELTCGMRRRKLANLHSYFIFSFRNERLCGSPHLMFIMTFKWYYCSRESFCSHLNCCVTKVRKKKALDGDLVSSSLLFSLFSFGCSFTTAWQAFSQEQLFSLNGPCRNWFVWPESKREKGEQKRKDTCASRLRFSSGHVTNLRARLICA